jgi:hypothetical protein
MDATVTFGRHFRKSAVEASKYDKAGLIRTFAGSANDEVHAAGERLLPDEFKAKVDAASDEAAGCSARAKCAR